MNKEEVHLFPILKELYSHEQQAQFIMEMAKESPPDPAGTKWLFNSVDGNDREREVRILMDVLPEQMFEGFKAEIREIIPASAWADLTRRIPHLNATQL